MRPGLGLEVAVILGAAVRVVARGGILARVPVHLGTPSSLPVDLGPATISKHKINKVLLVHKVSDVLLGK